MDWTLNFSGILNCSLALRESARLFLLLRGWFWGFDGVMALDKPLRGQNVPWDNKKAHKTTVIKPVFERTSSDTNACCSGKIRITLFSSSAMRGRLRPRGRSRCWEAVISKNATKHSLPLFFHENFECILKLTRNLLEFLLFAFSSFSMTEFKALCLILNIAGE